METSIQDISSIRENITRIDDQIVDLFIQRMEQAAAVAAYKKANNKPILDAAQERRKLIAIREQLPEEFKDYGALLYSTIFEISRAYQNKLNGTGSELAEEIRYAIDNTPELFPANVSVACQGVEGANSQTACDKVFKNANILYFKDFDAVFSAVEQGLCNYGVVPVENSTAGSVNAVYDLMQKHKFSIVRSVRVKIQHNLLVKPGTKLSDIKEIYSHEQAITQCSQFLSTLKGVKIIPCENTAMAARKVSESDRNDIAAISSRSCIRLYGLESLSDTIQNNANNYTRFICISKKLEIYPGADKTSLMATLPDEEGALYKFLAKFYVLGINLNKLESRPIQGRDFEFRFYFDLDVPVYSPGLLQLLGELSKTSESFSYLGSYSEVL